jgi:hypothetical protein
MTETSNPRSWRFHNTVIDVGEVAGLLCSGPTIGSDTRDIAVMFRQGGTLSIKSLPEAIVKDLADMVDAFLSKR